MHSGLNPECAGASWGQARRLTERHTLDDTSCTSVLLKSDSARIHSPYTQTCDGLLELEGPASGISDAPSLGVCALGDYKSQP